MSLLVFASAGMTAQPVPTKDKWVPAVKYLGPKLPNIEVIPAHMPLPATSTGIGTGSQILMDRPDGSFLCTANFVWDSGSTKYLGAAGHCFVEADKSSTHGPDADYNPASTKVYVCVSECDFGGQLGSVFGTFAELGAVAYARQDRGGAAAGEDFGIVEIPQSLHSQIRNSMPVWGGPNSVEDVSLGRQVCVYGNAAGLGEVWATKARSGVGQGLSSNQRYWVASIPSFQGDSGSGLITCAPDGGGMHGVGAAGVITHIALVGVNGGRMLGTTVGQAADMTLRDAGLAIKLTLADGSLVAPAAPPPPPPPPPPPVVPDPPNGSIGLNQTYSWSAGPFTRQAPLVDSILFGDECDAVNDEGDFCDYEYVGVTVPAGGAVLKVTIASGKPESDFDLFVFRPNGQELDRSTASATPPEVVEKTILQSGTYIIAVDPYSVDNDSYSGTVTLLPIPQASPVTGNPRIYQNGLVDPFIAGGHAVVPGTSVRLSVRTIQSASVTLSVTPEPNFVGLHRILRNGVEVFGPFETLERADGTNFRTDSDWVVPNDAPSGTYVFEGFVTVNGQTYKTGSLEFTIL